MPGGTGGVDVGTVGGGAVEFTLAEQLAVPVWFAASVTFTIAS